MSFFRKRVFYNSVPSYKFETKSVKCHGVYLNRTKWIRRNNIKQRTLYVYYFLIKRNKLFGQPNIYRVVGNWWYKRKGGDSKRKKKSRI